MKYVKRLAVTAFAAAAFSLGASSLLQAQDAPPGDAGNGKRLYLVDGCFTCHGRSGQVAPSTVRRQALPRPTCRSTDLKRHQFARTGSNYTAR